MRLAVVLDSPRGSSPWAGLGGQYLQKTLEACAKMTGVDLEVEAFYGVASPQPGRKAPPIADIRAERPRLAKELQAFNPEKILSVGASALNAMDDGDKGVAAISRKRGVMRLWNGVPWVATISNLSVLKSSDLHRDFAADVYKILAQDAPLPKMDIELHVPISVDELRDALELLEGATAVGVDVETTGLKAYEDELLAVGIGATYDATSGIAIVVSRDLMTSPTVEQEVADALWDAVWRRTRRAVGHNFKFDLQFMDRLVGWPPDEALLGDTMLLAHLLDERPGGGGAGGAGASRVRGLGLKDQVAVRYDHEYGFDFSSGPVTDFDALHEYLGEDVVYTARLWHDLAAEADEESPDLMRCHDELLMPTSTALARAEYRGAPVNRVWVEQTVAELDNEIAAEQERLTAELAVLLARVPGWNVPAELNVMSPTQVADAMYGAWKMTPDIRGRNDNARSTDKEHIRAAIVKYRGTEKDEEATWLEGLEKLRKATRLRTTYQKSLLDRLDENDRVHAGFLMHGTSTGRLSSQGPNLQNIPAINRLGAEQDRPMRRAFEPGPGRLWVEVDYKQLELRVAAAMSADEKFSEVFRQGLDVHGEVAKVIFSKDQPSDTERFISKAVSFGIIYGRSAKALANGAEMEYMVNTLGGSRWTEEQAGAFMRKFLRDYPQLEKWIADMHARVPLQQRYVESPYGRRRRFPLAPKSNGELGSIRRQAVNTPIQSAASDICLEAMVRIQRRLDAAPEVDAVVLFPVHDSICLEVAEQDLAALERICREEMERDWMGVPLRVDFEYGANWALANKWKPKEAAVA